MTGPVIVRYGHAIDVEVGKSGDWKSDSLRERIGVYHQPTSKEQVEVSQTMNRGVFILQTSDHIEMRVDISKWLDAHGDLLLVMAKKYRADRGLPDPLSQTPVQLDAGLVVGPAGRGNTPTEAPAAPKADPKPYKCPVCKRFGTETYLTCNRPDCPDGRDHR